MLVNIGSIRYRSNNVHHCKISALIRGLGRMSVLRADAPFFWPLRGSLALQNGSGSPTFTRATAAWEFNETGKLYKVPSGAVRMRGYRPVINLASQCSPPSSETFSTGWAKNGVTTPTANSMVVDGTTSPKFIVVNTAPTLTAGSIYCATYRVQYIDIKYVQLVGQSVVFGSGVYCNFDLINGVSNPTGCTATITAVSAGVWDVSITATATTTAANAIVAIGVVPALSSARLANFVGDSVKSLNVYRYQFEDVTGCVDQTPSEYVSFGILSAPYHGAVVDGVKYFPTYKDGTPIPEANLLGARLNPAAVTNNLLHCRDLTNAVWVKTNVNPTLNQTGIDGQSNACSLVEFTADGGTVLQTITAAAAAGCSGYYVKRHTGSGTVEFTRDNVNWLDITSSLTESGFYFAKIENTSVTNPVIGFRGQNGNKIIVDAGINHLGAQICETPILTTTAAVTVNAEVLTAPTASNFSDTAGTILATVTRDDWTAGNGSAVGSSTRGLYTSSANSGAQGLDGTNTVNGPSGTPSGTMRIGIRWSGSSMQLFSNGVFQSAGSYDGSFNLASIAAAAGVQCTIKDIAIWQTSLSDEDMISASKGMTIDSAAASLTLSAPDGHLLTGRTIAAAAVSLALTAPSSQIIIGRYIQATPANLLLTAPDGERIIGQYIQANAATITLTAPDGRVLLDDSPRSAKTITATLASPTITARL